ncbi:MAG: TIGR02281 family clan AA aspartic protease [Pseudomonadota bacterium]
MRLFDTIALTLLLVIGGVFLAVFLSQRPAEAVAVCEPAPEAAAAVQPSQAEEPEESYGRMASLNRDRRNSHFYANAIVNQGNVKFLVDTGASSVVLSKADAQKLGIDPLALDYSWPIKTAGGDTRGAHVVLNRIKIQGIEVKNVDAMVLETPLETPLLGMTFLRELYSYEFRKKHLILRQ